MRVPMVDPMAIPLMNAAAIVANAYVVGPMTSASSRVHATSYTSAVNPEMPATALASFGDGSDTEERQGRKGRKGRKGLKDLLSCAGFFAMVAASALAASDGARESPSCFAAFAASAFLVSCAASQKAPPAARRFNATPIQVV